MLIPKIKQTIKKFGLIQKHETVLVAVSGGPDSVALLYLLSALKKDLKIDLCVAHLDHMLRKDSIKDREFVLDLAKKLNLPVVIGRVDIAKFSEDGSLEEVARNKRQEFLFRVAKRCKAHKIALAHNRDDQAETVLMRIVRGSGLYGLNAILPKRRINGFSLIRPLIETSRKEIEAYLKRKKVSARLDKTNLEDIYFRNKKRNKLLPYLERDYNPNIKGVLANLASTVAVDYDFLVKQASRIFRQNRKIGKDNQVGFDLEKLCRLHPAMFRLVVRLAYAQLKGNLRRLTFQHLKEVEDLVFNRPGNSIVDLPGEISAKKKKKTVNFYMRR
ncbi:MAG: tRNA lysidine(34) synthetase TilS [Candidatus Omnitrophica bacterium]|nr:tRNA lysidine(34) synthetase TilS [Candidatus Omnitrophota bacterium]